MIEQMNPIRAAAMPVQAGRISEAASSISTTGRSTVPPGRDPASRAAARSHQGRSRDHSFSWTPRAGVDRVFGGAATGAAGTGGTGSGGSGSTRDGDAAGPNGRLPSDVTSDTTAAERTTDRAVVQLATDSTLTWEAPQTISRACAAVFSARSMACAQKAAENTGNAPLGGMGERLANLLVEAGLVLGGGPVGGDPGLQIGQAQRGTGVAQRRTQVVLHGVLGVAEALAGLV